MSAKQLEDFISVIESAERLSSSIKRLDLPPPSYNNNNNVSPMSSSASSFQHPPRVHVPRLWQPKTGSEFLGSSWGSTTAPSPPPSTTLKSSTSGPATTTTTTATPDTVKAKLTSTTTTAKTTISTQTSKPGDSKEFADKKVSTASPPEDGTKLLFGIQRHGTFGRIQAADLTPAASPESSPAVTRKKSIQGGLSTNIKPHAAPRTSAGGATASKHRKLKLKTVKVDEDDESSNDDVDSDEGKFVEDIISAVQPMESPRKSPPKPTVKPTKASPKMKRVLKKPHPSTIKNESTKKTSIKKRPKSAPPPRPKLKPKPPPKPPQVDLRSYSKSLKLLGFDIPSNRREATKLTHQDVIVRTTSPVVKTRLRERTQSVSDIQDVIDSKSKIDKMEFATVKDALKRAVFEEWYFRKNRLEGERRRREAEKKMEKLYEKELESERKKEEGEKEFKKWLNKKKAEAAAKAKMLDNSKKENRFGLLSLEEKENRVREWKKVKREELEKKMKDKKAESLKQEEEEKKKRQKREESKEKFLDWQKKELEKHREEKKKIKEAKEAELEKKKEEEKEKREASEAVFNKWNKDKGLMLKKEAETSLEEANRIKREQERRRRKRFDEASDAYEKWLDKVEERQFYEEYEDGEGHDDIRLLYRPPWYPAGIAEI